MKEMIIISTNQNYINILNSYLCKYKNNGIVLIESIFDNENKIGIAYKDNFDISKILKQPLKRCLKIYKKQFFDDMNLNTKESIITKFVNLNLEREYFLCFEKVKNCDKMYIDSIFMFLTKEIEFSWTKIGEIINENNDLLRNENKKNLIKFIKTKDKKN